MVLPPGQRVVFPETDAVTADPRETVTLVELEQLPLETVTEYVVFVVGETTMEVVVAVVFHT